MHVGKSDTNCPSLKVNNKEMKTTDREKYLGDIITNDAKIDENIQMRHDKGLGLVNQIISILKEISFGRYHFEMGMLLRTSVLINGMLYSTEALSNLTIKHINLLEECDKMFMRKLFDAELGTPIESFYLETAAWPIRFILMGRSLMYYWTILNKSESELVKAVYNAQKEYPTKNSWALEIQGVLKTCEIYNTEEEIKSMTKIKFKAIVKEKIQIRVMCYLIGLQNKHSKSKNLVMGAEMQKYLCCNEMSL